VALPCKNKFPGFHQGPAAGKGYAPTIENRRKNRWKTSSPPPPLDNLGWLDPRPPPWLRRLLYWSPLLPLRTDPAVNTVTVDNQGQNSGGPRLRVWTGRSKFASARLSYRWGSWVMVRFFFGSDSKLREILHRPPFFYKATKKPKELWHRATRSDVPVQTKESVCLVTVELTPHTYTHLREALCLLCLLSTVMVTPTVQKGFKFVNRSVSLRRKEALLLTFWSKSSKFRKETSCQVRGGESTPQARFLWTWGVVNTMNHLDLYLNFQSLTLFLPHLPVYDRLAKVCSSGPKTILQTLNVALPNVTNGKICDFSDRSQTALNIRPSPGKNLFTVGPYEW